MVKDNKKTIQNLSYKISNILYILVNKSYYSIDVSDFQIKQLAENFKIKEICEETNAAATSVIIILQYAIQYPV